MIVIGLTGGIGTGKSTVSGFLAELGAAVIDADKLGHELYRPHGEAWQEVVAAFGREILDPDGQINRPRLGQIVFRGPESLKRLNSIMHPRMRRLAAERLEEFRRQGVKLAVLEAAILIEANWTDLADQVWAVVAPEDVVVERLVRNKGLSAEQVKARIHAQLSAEERIKRARVVIYTNCDLDEVRWKVRLHWQHLVAGQASLPVGSALKEKIKQVLSGRVSKHIDDPKVRRSAVLLPLFEKQGQYYLLFTRRTEGVNYHKGQISFPGGRHEHQDKTELQTALREGFEEIGLRPEDVEILGKLDDMPTVVSNFIIAPFVAIIPGDYNFVTDPVEVKEIICVPLSAFWKDTRFWIETARQGRPRPTFFWDYKGQVIWGATGLILKSFLDLILPPPYLAEVQNEMKPKL